MKLALRLLIISLLATSLFAGNPTGGVVPIGADANWTTDGIFRNVSDHPITQKVGYLTFTHPYPGFDPIIVEPTITLAPGETRRIVDMQQRFDRGRNYILPIQDGLEASVFLKFIPGTTRFEVSNVNAHLTQVGPGLDFARIATSYDPPMGTFILVMNTSSGGMLMANRLFGPTREVIGEEYTTVPAGISLYGIQHEMKDGGSVRVCINACGVGAPGTVSPVYVFAIMGPPDGGTQAVRYAEETAQ